MINLLRMSSVKRVLFCVLIVFSTVLNLSAQSELFFVASEDAYVRNGGYANDTYGGEALLLVKYGSEGFKRDAFVKFDVNPNNIKADDIDSAFIKLYLQEVNGDMDISVFACSSNWNEVSICSTNAPQIQSTNVLATHTVLATDNRSFVVINASEFLKQSLSTGETNVSIALSGDALTKKTATFVSRNNSDLALQPKLILYTNTDVVINQPKAPFRFSTKEIVSPENGTFVCSVLDSVKTTAALGTYGGWLNKRVGATGFYRSEFIDSAWHLVDPEGYLFTAMGITSVERGGGLNLPQDIKQWGINTLGNWSEEIIQGLPICPRFTFLQSFKSTSDYRKNLYNQDIFPVFDAGFAAWVDEKAKEFVTPYKNYKWVLGYHTDNELRFHYVDINSFLSLPETDPHYIAAKNFMMERKGALSPISDTDKEDFQAYVAGFYMETVNNALKRHDPNHLNIGCRIHAAVKYNEKLMKAIGAHVDVMSINFYGKWYPSTDHMDMWLSEAEKPFIITEFYAKGEDVGMDNIDGAGWKVNTQDERAAHFENFALKLLAHPGSVGWTYFRYKDKNGTNRGLVSEDYNFYMPLAESMKQIAQDAYNLRRYLLGQELIIETPSATEPINTDLIDAPGIFPNPAHSILTIILPKSKTYKQIKVYSLNGNCMLSKYLLGGEVHLDVSELCNGMYLLNFTGNGLSHNMKFSVNK